MEKHLHTSLTRQRIKLPGECAFGVTGLPGALVAEF